MRAAKIAKETPGVSPAFLSYSGLRRRSLELLVDREPEESLDVTSAAGGIKVCNYVAEIIVNIRSLVLKSLVIPRLVF